MLLKTIHFFRNRSLKEFVKILKAVAFVNAPYFVYVFDNEVRDDLNISHENKTVKIKKGNLSELRNPGCSVKPTPWEFECHQHDGVTEFFIAKNDDGIQHISWIYYHEHHNRLLSLGKNEAEIKYCLTLPAFRGREIYPAVIRDVTRDLRAHNVSRIFMCVRCNNLPSIRGIEKAGFRKVAKFRFVRILGVQLSARLKTGYIW